MGMGEIGLEVQVWNMQFNWSVGLNTRIVSRWFVARCGLSKGGLLAGCGVGLVLVRLNSIPLLAPHRNFDAGRA